MSYIDKNNILASIKTRDFVSFELGCGAKKTNPQAIGIDILDYPQVDIVGDIFEVLAACPAHSVDAIFSSHFFEHIERVDLLLEVIARVLKDDGKLEIIVPHFSNPYFYSDYSHKTMFGLYSFSYFAKDGFLKRKVPNYNKELRFKLERVDLFFKSPKPFYFRYALKKVIQLFVNLTSFTKEFYEENLCYMIPCYEVGYRLVKRDNQQHNLKVINT